MSYGLAMPTGEAYGLASAAQEQVSAALTGGWISSYGTLGPTTLAPFLQAPVNVEGGYIKSAFWLGVAARVLRSRSLALSAGKVLALGYGGAFVPGTTTDAAMISRIMQEAAQLILATATATSDPQQRGNGVAVAAQLRAIASTSAISARQQDKRGWLQWAQDNAAPLGAGLTAIVGGAAYLWMKRKRR